ncbi:MAG: hypothetical protein ACREVV_10770, partial [Steroidobacteraceae bacterium]
FFWYSERMTCAAASAASRAAWSSLDAMLFGLFSPFLGGPASPSRGGPVNACVLAESDSGGVVRRLDSRETTWAID